MARQEGILVASFDPSGTELWTRSYGGFYDFQLVEYDYIGHGGREVALTESGDVIATGSFGGEVDFGGGVRGPDTFLPFVLALTADGDYLWDRVFGEVAGRGSAQSVTVAPEGEIALAGANAEGSSLNHGDFIGLGPDGSDRWLLTDLSDDGSVRPFSIASLAADGFLATGIFVGVADFGCGKRSVSRAIFVLHL